MKVLMVEDEAQVATYMKETLAREVPDFSCETAHLAKDGLELAGCQDFDAVVLDLRLPDTATADETLVVYADLMRRVPTVVVTAVGDPTFWRRALKAGAADYVMKQSGLARLSLALQWAVERKRLIDEHQQIDDTVKRMGSQVDEMKTLVEKLTDVKQEAAAAPDKPRKE